MIGGNFSISHFLLAQAYRCIIHFMWLCFLFIQPHDPDCRVYVTALLILCLCTWYILSFFIIDCAYAYNLCAML